MNRFVALCALAAFALFSAACGRPSVGLGYRIPGTPVSIGGSVPIGNSPGAQSKLVYRQFELLSNPTGAEIYVNNALVGTTPSTISVPFEKGTFGGAKGSVRILLKKSGYLPEGFSVFPGDNGAISLSSDGNPSTKKVVWTLKKN